MRAAGDHAGALALGGAALACVCRGDEPGASPVSAAPGEAAASAPADRAVVELRLCVGELAALCGDLSRADTALAPVVNRADLAPPVLGRARLALARACEAGGQIERAERLFRAVVDQPPGAIEPDPLSGPEAQPRWAARDLALHYIRRGRPADAVTVAEAALGRTPAPEGALADHLRAARALARGLIAPSPAALVELEALAAAAAEQGDLALRAAALHAAARLAFAAGEHRLAHAHYQSALAAAEAEADMPRIATLRMNLAAMEYSFGEFATALAHYASALALLVALGLRTTEVLARRNFGHLLIELGEVEQARVELGAAARAATELGLTVHQNRDRGAVRPGRLAHRRPRRCPRPPGHRPRPVRGPG